MFSRAGRYHKTGCRLATICSVMNAMLQDVRYAVRALRRNAGLTVVIVVSLAIGIGANTAIFSVVNALLLEPLPYPDPERLAVLWLRSPGINIPQDWPSPGQYIDLRSENRSFDEMSISRGRSGTLLGIGRAHGARGGAEPHPDDGAPAGAAAHRRRQRDRPGRRRRADPGDGEPAVWRERDRPRHLHHGAADSDRNGRHRQLHSGAARHARRSRRRAARRIVVSHR